jgi:hypothetical protein
LNEINTLARKNGVQLASGIEMRLQEVEQPGDEKSSRKSSKEKEALNVFPRMLVHFEVAGQYSNLRSFISQLEKSNQFLLLDSVNLTSAEAGEGRGGSGGGSGINLSINLSAYFQP